MIDVTEGDWYVVDIKSGSPDPLTDPNYNANSWNRYLIDMGPKLKETDSYDRLGTILTSIVRKTDDYGVIKMDAPWDESEKPNPDAEPLEFSGPNVPRLRSIVITHSDADHCQNAPQLLEQLSKVAYDDVPMNTMGRILPVLLSPMWQWTEKVIFETGKCEV